MNTDITFKSLFIAGCARSGTTALTRLLNSHEDIFIGTEVFRAEFSAESSRFGRELILTERFQSKLAEKKESPTSLQYIGDKFPSYYNNYDLIFSRFNNVKVIFIFRNIFDVAQSYKARKIHPTNPWNKGVRRAIKEWNTSLSNTLDHINTGQDINPVCYETILFKPTNKLESILNFKESKQFQNYYKKVTRDAFKIEEKRLNILDHKEKLWIMRNARFDLYNKLFEISAMK